MKSIVAGYAIIRNGAYFTHKQKGFGVRKRVKNIIMFQIPKSKIVSLKSTIT